MLKLYSNSVSKLSNNEKIAFNARNDHLNEYMGDLLKTIHSEIENRNESFVELRPKLPVVNYRVNASSGKTQFSLLKSGGEKLLATFDSSRKLQEIEHYKGDNQIATSDNDKSEIIGYLETMYSGLANGKFDDAFTMKVGRQEYPVESTGESLDALFMPTPMKEYPTVESLRQKHSINFFA